MLQEHAMVSSLHVVMWVSNHQLTSHVQLVCRLLLIYLSNHKIFYKKAVISGCRWINPTDSKAQLHACMLMVGSSHHCMDSTCEDVR